MITLVSRVVPPRIYAGRARAVVERAFLVSRREWILPLSGFFEPIFYLTAMGIGIDGLIGNRFHSGGYTAYIAPGLLAASAMNGAVYDATFNIFYKLKYNRIYDCMLSTSLGPMDVAIGEITWALIRGGIYSLGFLIVVMCAGLANPLWGLLALPAALLVSFAFSSVGMACTTFMRSWQDFGLVHLAVIPMFLCSTTFFPLSVYPEPIQWLIQALPLYHGIELIRNLMDGLVGLSLIGHIVYLAVMAILGVVIASRRIDKLLLK